MVAKYVDEYDVLVMWLVNGYEYLSLFFVSMVVCVCSCTYGCLVGCEGKSDELHELGDALVTAVGYVMGFGLCLFELLVAFLL